MSIPLVLATLLLSACTVGPVAAPRPPHEAAMPAASPQALIRYSIRLEDARAHQVRVSMYVTAPGGAALPDTVELAMPVWTPGSYLVREFARHVLELSARDERGRMLSARKTEKHLWVVETGGARELVVDYLLYANERSVRTSHVDGDHAFLSPAATFLFVRGRLAEPHAVTIAAPTGWRIFTALPAADTGFVARDYDQLVDSPIEIGPHRELHYSQDGVDFRIVLAGAGELDEQQLLTDVAAVTREVGAIFGTRPFDSYLFLFVLVDSGGGGLEHADSSVCMVSRWAFTKRKDYRSFLALVAHEYFHAWNVKRFRPEALGPFDYERENYTPDLWVAEGITSFYDDLCALRAGVAGKPEEWLAERATTFRDMARLPGAARTSIAQSSHDAWIRFYRPDENSRNATVSYYTKGALVALLLDLRLRRLTGNAHDLQSVLRLGWERYAVPDRGFPPGALQALAEEVAGHDLSDFFAQYVTGTAPLDVEADLEVVGLTLQRQPEKTERALPRDEQGFALAPDLGLETADASGLCRVSVVLEGGPAWRAGLNVDDVILAVDGWRVSHSTLTDRLDRGGPGPRRISFYRGQSLRELQIEPAFVRLETWEFRALPEPNEAQRAAFRALTSHELPGAVSAANDEAEAAAPSGAR